MKRLGALLALGFLVGHLGLPLAAPLAAPQPTCGCAPGACLCALAQAMSGESHCHGGAGMQFDRCDRTPDEGTVVLPPLAKASPVAPAGRLAAAAPGRLSAQQTEPPLELPAPVDPRPPRPS